MKKKFGKKALSAALALGLSVGMGGTASAKVSLFPIEGSGGVIDVGAGAVKNNSTETDIVKSALDNPFSVYTPVAKGVNYQVLSGSYDEIFGAVATDAVGTTVEGTKLEIVGHIEKATSTSISKAVTVTGAGMTNDILEGAATYKNNKVIINTDATSAPVTVAAVSLANGSREDMTVEDNFVQVDNCSANSTVLGIVSVGAASTSGKHLYIKNNKVDIKGGGTFSAAEDGGSLAAITAVQAGRVEVTTGIPFTAIVTENSLNIYGGSFVDMGYASTVVALYPGTYNKNAVTLLGGEFDTTVANTYNMVGAAYTLGVMLELYGDTATMNDNAVNIGGRLNGSKVEDYQEQGLDLSKAVLFGAWDQAPGQTPISATGNSLNVFSAGNKVGGLLVNTFQNINFYIPSDKMDATGSNTMLAVGGTATIDAETGETKIDPNLDLSNVQISAGVVNVGTYTAGNKITLISTPGTLTTSGNYGKLTDGVMNVDLTYEIKDGNKLVASTAGENPGVEEDAKSPVETQAAGVALLNTGSDMMSGDTLNNMEQAVAANRESGYGAQGGSGSAAGSGFGSQGGNGSAAGSDFGAQGGSGSQSGSGFGTQGGSGSTAGSGYGAQGGDASAYGNANAQGGQNGGTGSGTDGKGGSAFGKDGKKDGSAGSTDGKDGSAYGKDGKKDGADGQGGKSGSAYGKDGQKSGKDGKKDSSSKGSNKTRNEADVSRMLTPFLTLGGSSQRVETGSHVSLKSWNVNFGFTKEIKNKSGKFLFAPIFEYGKGSYDSYLDNGTHGDGTSSFWGLGFLGKQSYHSGAYIEGSIRVGRLNNDYSAIIAEKDMSYDNSATYYAAHIGVGKVVPISAKENMDYYGKLFYSHQNSSSATLKSGHTYDFHSVNSWRTRLGFRYTYKMDRYNSLFAGLAWQHEFGSRCGATIHTGDLFAEAPAPSAKGETGIIELGCKLKPNKNDRFEIDLGFAGYMGKQKGIGGSAQFRWNF